MKERIITFIIGLLVGAVLATGAFYIYTKVINNNNSNEQTEQVTGENRPEMSGGQNGEMGEPPEKPSGENGEPPEKPSGENSKNSDSKKSSSSSTTENN